MRALSRAQRGVLGRALGGGRGLSGTRPVQLRAVSTVPSVSDAQLAQFAREGYVELEGVVPFAHLDMMRDVALKLAKMEEDRVKVTGPPRNDDDAPCAVSLALAMHEDLEPQLSTVIFADYMATINRAFLGDNAYYHYSELMLRRTEEPPPAYFDPPRAWRQASSRTHHEHTPFLCCWLPLGVGTSEGPVAASNAPLRVMPFPAAAADERCSALATAWRASSPEGEDLGPVYEHVAESEGDSGPVALVGGAGDGEVLLSGAAGSVVVFSSLLLHSTTGIVPSGLDGDIRAGLHLNYTAEPVLDGGSGLDTNFDEHDELAARARALQVHHKAEELLVAGKLSEWARAQRNKWRPEGGGPRGHEPTRFGDWESKGRCWDF